MINRILIRIKVVQMLYSYIMTNDGATVAKFKRELEKSLDKSHELYHWLLQLMIDMTDYQDLRLDENKHKFLPSQEDLNPNMRFVNNQFIAALRDNQELKQMVKDCNIAWRDDEIFLRLMLDKVLNSEYYERYMSMEKTDFESDCEVWSQLMKQVILVDGDLLEFLESKSVYWGFDDVEVMGQFALKTIRKFEKKARNPMSPKFKDDDDRDFGMRLFTKTIDERVENNKLIDEAARSGRWESDRLATMDRIIMCAALTEIQNFDSIPVNVTLNEYIEMAKNYSTPRSGQFINGILNTIVKQLRANGSVTKP